MAQQASYVSYVATPLAKCLQNRKDSINDQWVERFRNTSLARKMMVVYAAIFGILCGITLLAMQVTLSIYDGQLYQKSLEELNFFTERVDGELKKVEELSFDQLIN